MSINKLVKVICFDTNAVD